MNDITQYISNGITDEEVAFTQSSIGQSDARNYETGIQKAAFIGRILQYNLPADYTSKQNTILHSITKGDLNSITRKYLNAGKMNIVLVGDKAVMMPGLQRLGYEMIEMDAKHM